MSKIQMDQGIGKFLISVFFSFTPYYIGAFFSLAALHYIQSELPFLAKELALLTNGKPLSFSSSLLIWFALGIIFFRTSSRLLFFFPARIVQRDMRVEIMKRLEKALPIRYQEKFNSGQIFQIVGNDIDQIRALIGFGLLQVGNIIIALLILIPKLYSFSPHLMVSLTPMIVGFLFFTLIMARNRKYYRKTQDLQGKINQFIIESYEGKETIQNYQKEDLFYKKFQSTSFSELFNFYMAGRGVAFSIPLVPLGVGAALLWGAYVIQSQELGGASLVLYSGFIFLFLEPLMYLSWIGVVFSRSIVSWDRFKELINLMNTASSREREILRLNEGQVLKSNCFSYGVSFWDQAVKLNFEMGKQFGIISQTGHGKSEIIKQLAFITKSKEIQASYVAQAPYLYNDTIEENLFLGQEKSSRDILLAKKLLEVFELQTLDQNLNSLLSLEVGESGKRLSGGQAKRVCLIRSLLSESQILFWDDPFSSIDLILERKIMQDLEKLKLFENKCLVLSTHRLSTLRNCHEYFFFEKNNGIIESAVVNESMEDKESKVYEYFKEQLAENILI